MKALGELIIPAFFALVTMVVFYFIFIWNKHRKPSKWPLITFAAIAVVLGGVLSWFLTPVKVEISENSSFYIPNYKNLGDLWIEDQEDYEAIRSLLENLTMQRRLGSYKSNLPDGINSVKASDYLFIEIIDEINGTIGYYTFVISSQSGTYFSYGDYTANGYKLLNAKDIIDDLYELIKYSKSSMG